MQLITDVGAIKLLALQQHREIDELKRLPDIRLKISRLSPVKSYGLAKCQK